MKEKNQEAKITVYEVFKPIVEEIIENKLIRLSKEDIDELVEKLIPKIDEIVAAKIRQHIHLLTNEIKSKIKE